MSSFLNAASGLLGGRAAQVAAAAAASLGNAVTNATNAVKQQTQQQQPPPPPGFRETPTLPSNNSAVRRVYDSNLNPQNQFDAVAVPRPIQSNTPFAGLPVIVGNRRRSLSPPPENVVVRRYDSNLNPENQVLTPAVLAPSFKSEARQTDVSNQRQQPPLQHNHIQTNHISATTTMPSGSELRHTRPTQSPTPPQPTIQPPIATPSFRYADDRPQNGRSPAPQVEAPTTNSNNNSRRRPSVERYADTNHKDFGLTARTDQNVNVPSNDDIGSSQRNFLAAKELKSTAASLSFSTAPAPTLFQQNERSETNDPRQAKADDVIRPKQDRERSPSPGTNRQKPTHHNNLRRKSSEVTATTTLTSSQHEDLSESLHSNELSNKRLLLAAGFDDVPNNEQQNQRSSARKNRSPRREKPLNQNEIKRVTTNEAEPTSAAVNPEAGYEHIHPIDRLLQSNNSKAGADYRSLASVTDDKNTSHSHLSYQRKPSPETKHERHPRRGQHADYAVNATDSPLCATAVATPAQPQSNYRASPPPSSSSIHRYPNDARKSSAYVEKSSTADHQRRRPHSPADLQAGRRLHSSSRPLSARTSDQFKQPSNTGRPDADLPPSSSHHQRREEQHRLRGRHKQLQSILVDNEERSQTPGGSSDSKPLSNVSAVSTLTNDLDKLNDRKYGYTKSRTSHASLSPVHRRRRPPPGTVPSFVVVSSHRPNANSPPLSTSDRRSLNEYVTEPRRCSSYRPASYNNHHHHHHHQCHRSHHHHHCHHRHRRPPDEETSSGRMKYGPAPFDIDQMARRFLLSPRSKQRRLQQQQQQQQQKQFDIVSENGAVRFSSSPPVIGVNESSSRIVRRPTAYANKQHLFDQQQQYSSEASSGRSRDDELSLPPIARQTVRATRQQQVMLRNRSHDDEEMTVFYDRQSEYERDHNSYYENYRLKRAPLALEAAITSGASSLQQLVLEVNDAAVGGGDLLTIRVCRRALNETFGIEVRGGNDSGEIPVYISAVAVDSYADIAGLQAGDQIITINDEPCANVMTHDNAVQIIKAALVLKLDILRMSLPTTTPTPSAATRTVVLPPASTNSLRKSTNDDNKHFKTSDYQQTMLALAPSKPTYERNVEVNNEFASNAVEIDQLSEAFGFTGLSNAGQQQQQQSPTETTQDERDANNLLSEFLQEQQQQQNVDQHHVYDEPWEHQQRHEWEHNPSSARQKVIKDRTSSNPLSYRNPDPVQSNNDKQHAQTLTLKRMSPPPPPPVPSHQFYTTFQTSNNQPASTAAYFSDSETRYAHRTTLPVASNVAQQQQPPIRQLSFPRYYKPSASPDLFATPPRLRRYAGNSSTLSGPTMGSRAGAPLMWSNNISSRLVTDSSHEVLDTNSPNAPHRHHSSSSNVEWVLADNGRPCSPPNPTLPTMNEHSVELRCDTNQKLGLLIRGGGELGIFISGVEHDSAASTCGLRAGDQIIAVNNQSFYGISHTRAVRILRKCWHAVVRVRSVGKVPYARRVLRAPPPSNVENAAQQILPPITFPKLRRSSRLSGINSFLNSGGGGSGSTSADEAATSLSSMLSLTNTDDSTLHWLGSISDRADVVLSNSSPASKAQLLFHINEYVRGASTLDMLMLALFDVLETPYKLELLYEIKNIIRPKDLSRFDALSHTMRLDWLKPATNTLASNVLPGPTEFAPVSAILDEAFQLRTGGPVAADNSSSNYPVNFSMLPQHPENLCWPPPPSLSVQQQQQHFNPSSAGVGGGGGGLPQQIPFKYCSFPPNYNAMPVTNNNANNSFLWNAKPPLSAVMEEAEGMVDNSHLAFPWPHQQFHQQQQQQQQQQQYTENDVTPQAMPLTPLYINEPRDDFAGSRSAYETQPSADTSGRRPYVEFQQQRSLQEPVQSTEAGLRQQPRTTRRKSSVAQPAPFLHSHSDSQAMQTYVKSSTDAQQQQPSPNLRLTRQPSLSLEDVPSAQQQQQQQRVRFQSEPPQQNTLTIPANNSSLHQRRQSSIKPEPLSKLNTGNTATSAADASVIYAEPYQQQQSRDSAEKWPYPPPPPPGSGASNPQYSQHSLSPYHQFYHPPPMMDEAQMQAWHYAQMSGQPMSISPYGHLPPNPYDPTGSGTYQQTSPSFMQSYPEGGNNMRPNSLAFNKMPKKMLKTVEPTKDETVVVKKLAPYLGIAIEGGKDTKQPLPRIINIQRDGCAHLAGRLRVGHVIKSVNGTSLQGLSHSEAVQLITRLFSDANVSDLKFVVQEVNRLPST